MWASLIWVSGGSAIYMVNNFDLLTFPLFFFFFADVRKGEYITGFVVRSGFWIDGIQILTSLGNRSPFFGNKTGGDA